MTGCSFQLGRTSTVSRRTCYHHNDVLHRLNMSWILPPLVLSIILPLHCSSSALLDGFVFCHFSASSRMLRASSAGRGRCLGFIHHFRRTRGASSVPFSHHRLVPVSVLVPARHPQPARYPCSQGSPHHHLPSRGHYNVDKPSLPASFMMEHLRIALGAGASPAAHGGHPILGSS
jgi:hypothetical protein